MSIESANINNPLSKRERQVCGMLKLRNKVIARQLEITEGTVKNHVFVAMKKLQCKNRTELATKFLTQQVEALTAEVTRWRQIAKNMRDRIENES